MVQLKTGQRPVKLGFFCLVPVVKRSNLGTSPGPDRLQSLHFTIPLVTLETHTGTVFTQNYAIHLEPDPGLAEEVLLRHRAVLEDDVACGGGPGGQFSCSSKNHSEILSKTR